MPILEYRYDAAANLWRPWGRNRGGPIGGSTPNDRDSLVPRFFFPNATNVGHITPIAKMDTVTGLQNWGAEHDGATITKTRFTDRVTLDTQNITFRDCRFEGYLPNNTTGGSFTMRVTGARCQNVRFIDCTFKPKVADHGTHTIIGHHWTGTRCDFTGGVDAVSAVPYPSLTSRLDVRIEGSWLHDLAYFSPDSFHTTNPADNQTHNDCVQWGGGAGFAIVGCRVEGFADPTIGDATSPSVDSGGTHISGNSNYPKLSIGSGVLPVLAGSSYPQMAEFTCLGNWFSGGSVGLNLSGAPGSFTTNDGSIVDDNRFGYDWLSGQDYAILKKANQVIPIQNNYRWGGSHAPWFHGDAVTGLTHNEDVIDPWDKSVPFNIVKPG